MALICKHCGRPEGAHDILNIILMNSKNSSKAHQNEIDEARNIYPGYPQSLINCIQFETENSETEEKENTCLN